MERLASLCIFHPFDEPFNLPPAAKMDDIALVATAIGARRRFGCRHRPKFGHELGRIDNGVPVIKIEWCAHKI